VLADVAEGRRAEQGVADGVQEHVGIAVAVEADRGGNINPADDELSVLCKLVDVYADSYAHGVMFGCKRVLKKQVV
jgi:hypothetical protein